jgi:hypothetical protein
MKLDNNVSIDWISFTLPYSDVSMQRARSLGVGYEMENLSYGRFQYTRGVRILDGANIYFNPERKEMGIHVAINSASLALVNLRPLQMLNRIINWEGTFKRIDLAFDDFDSLLDVDEMYRKIEAGEVVMRYRKATRIFSIDVGSAEKTGDTVNLGRRSSESFIRIYDKVAEQLAKKQKLPDGVENWVRVELEMKGEKANAVGKILADTALSGSISAGSEAACLLYGLIDFKEVAQDDKNKSRWETTDWWKDFVLTSSKKTLSLPKKQKSVERSKVWMKNQVSSTLAMIVLSADDDNGRSGWDFVVACIVEGERRMSKQQQNMLDEYNMQQKEKFIAA